MKGAPAGATDLFAQMFDEDHHLGDSGEEGSGELYRATTKKFMDECKKPNGLARMKKLAKLLQDEEEAENDELKGADEGVANGSKRRKTDQPASAAPVPDSSSSSSSSSSSNRSLREMLQSSDFDEFTV